MCVIFENDLLYSLLDMYNRLKFVVSLSQPYAQRERSMEEK